MMCCHGGNPVLFNKKIKIGRPEHSLTPHLVRLITSHFCLIPHPPESGRHMCIMPNVKGNNILLYQKI